MTDSSTPSDQDAIPDLSTNTELCRRRFLSLLGTAATLTAFPTITRAEGAPHVVVIGGGFGGATAAKYLRLWSDGSIRVTLVDRNPHHYSCIQSNLVLNDQLTLDDLKFNLADLAKTHGYTYVQDTVESIDGKAGRVHLASGKTLSYDRLVVSPGTAFRPVDGLDPERIPHAWIAGPQTTILHNQLAAMPDKATFILSIPPAPYRCPPGPYERSCIVADMLKTRGGGKVIVLDSNPDITVVRKPFHAAYDETYPDIVEYHPNAALKAVDSDARIVSTSVGDFRGDVVNVIPTHWAPSFVRDSGLTGGGDWAPVHGLTFESTLDDFKGVHVIGDAQGLKLPKAGHIASSEAKVCVDAVVRMLANKPVDTAERCSNLVINSACLNEVAANQAVFLTAAYAYRPGAEDPWAGVYEHLKDGSGSAKTWSRKNHGDMFKWWQNLSRDVFS